MKIIIMILSICACINLSCAQQKQEKSPKFPPIKKDQIKKIKETEKLYYVINFGDLELNKNGLYCWKIDDTCNVLDGITTIYSHYQTTGDDNPSIIPYIYSKGEFLEGKYHGKWVFYDKNGKVIKEEKWNKGVLIGTTN